MTMGNGHSLSMVAHRGAKTRTSVSLRFSSHLHLGLHRLYAMDPVQIFPWVIQKQYEQIQIFCASIKHLVIRLINRVSDI